MDMEKRPNNILGVAGSMCSDSQSIKALKIALNLVKKRGAEVRMLDLSKTILPFRDPGAPAPAQVKATANDVVWADAFILASPDYHGSMSGATKNFTTFIPNLQARYLHTSLHRTKKV